MCTDPLPPDTYCFLGRYISVRSNSQAMFDRLRLMYRRFLADGAGREPDLALEIMDDFDQSGALEIKDPWLLYRMSRTGQQCHFSCQNVETGQFEFLGFCEPEILVQNAVLHTVAKACPDHVLVHAGAVELGGRALVFPAEPRMGKTTMVLRLATMGCGLLSDEVACFSRDSGRVDPFPRAVNVREDGMRMLGLAQDGPFVSSGTGAEGAEYAIDAEEMPGVRLSEGCEAGYLVFLRGFGDAPKLEVLSKGRALFRLADSCIGLIAEPASFLYGLAPLVEQMACYTLVIGDLDETVQLLMDLPSRTGGSRAEARP